jgi:hypothetical protein
MSKKKCKHYNQTEINEVFDGITPSSLYCLDCGKKLKTGL